MSTGDAEIRRILIDQLETLGVEHRPLRGRTDGFADLCYRGKPFAHFHGDNELDVRLGAAVIKREAIERPPVSVKHPTRSAKSPWMEVRFTKTKDLPTVIKLVKLAIKQL